MKRLLNIILATMLIGGWSSSFSLSLDPPPITTQIRQDTVTQKSRPKPFRMRLNQGRKITSKREISIEIRPRQSAALIAEMKISLRPDLRDASWELFKSTTTMSLEGSDGTKTVYAMLKDKAGNTSTIESAKLEFDTQAPTGGGISINNNAAITNNKTLKVRLNLKATKAFKMQISNSSSFEDARWEPYTAERNWLLSPPGDGEKTVYVKYADVVDNTSQVYSASILVDTTPPTGFVVINNNDKYTTSRNVKLTIESPSEDLVSIRVQGPKPKTISVNQSIVNNPMTIDWELDTLEGKKLVRVFFRDKAGNSSTDPGTDDIILDSKPPERPYLMINNGAKFTTNEEGKVDLAIRTRETPIGITMKVGNTPEFTDETTYKYQASIKGWILDISKDGYKTVFIKFKDAAGNESELSKTSITLDRSKPVAKSLMINQGEKYSHNPVVDIQVEAEGADLMQVSNKANFSGPVKWVTYQPHIKEWILVGEEGVNLIYARFRDLAGNVSSTISDEITIDTKPPAGKIIIDNGAVFTTNPERKVNIKVLYNSYASHMQISNDSTFKGAQWENAHDEINEWILKAGDGEKIVYARFKDDAGHFSSTVRDRILLDLTPPQSGKIIINRNAKYVTNKEKRVRVLINAKDAADMRVSENQSLEEVDWEPYQRAKEVILQGEDGEHIIYVQFRDANGNISESVSDNIILDREAPVPRLLVINEGSEWTNNPEKNVDIKINADGASLMKISQDGNFKELEWQPFIKSIPNFILEGEDGEKKVYIIFRDEAGNVSSMLTASIKLKRSF